MRDESGVHLIVTLKCHLMNSATVILMQDMQERRQPGRIHRYDGCLAG